MLIIVKLIGKTLLKLVVILRYKPMLLLNERLFTINFASEFKLFLIGNTTNDTFEGQLYVCSTFGESFNE